MVHLESDQSEPSVPESRHPDGYDPGEPSGAEQISPHPGFEAGSARARFVTSVREVVDAEEVHVISNEIYRPGPDRRGVAASPLRPTTLRELTVFGYEPPVYGLSGPLV